MDEQRTRERELLERARLGDRSALSELLEGVQDLIFNLSLRMLGTVPDAEDAQQEIMIRLMTGLGGFRGESAFSTWAFRVAVNHLKDYKKGLFSRMPVNFDFYGADIKNAPIEGMGDLTRGVDADLLAEELKFSCTNAMLQCLDAENRLIFVLGTMFHADSALAGELLGLSPAAYRQRLRRVRRQVAEFLDEHCGYGARGQCNCRRRVNYAIQTHRLDPERLTFLDLKRIEPEALAFKAAMEEIDDLALAFDSLPAYRAPRDARAFLEEFLSSARCREVRSGGKEQING